MPVRLYRVCRAKHARLDGYGAMLAGGRWNSPGRAVVYLAESVSLAVLENLVHMTREDFPRGYVVVSATCLNRFPFEPKQNSEPSSQAVKPPAKNSATTGWTAACPPC